MKKFYLIVAMLTIGVMTFAQEITVRFTGQLNQTDYLQLDSVKVTNTTRNWAETIEYPDTIIVLGSTTYANENFAQTQGLGQNIPNPFNCETSVELTISQSENVALQLLDISGKVYAELNSALEAGNHKFNISAANPQTYVLNAAAGKKHYSIRMVNVGSGCANFIKYSGASDGLVAKLATTNEFQTGDQMEYIGYATVESNTITSETVSQAQAVSQYVTLNFAYSFRPSVETVEATNITRESATLNGNVLSDGGAEIISRGFYYGTTSENLSGNLSCGIGESEFSAPLFELQSNTTYYYCAYATNSVGTRTGEILNFTTQNVSVPTIVTLDASNITTTSATLNAEITDNGGEEITARGFYYGISAENLATQVTSTATTSTFSETLELERNTTYYYKAYAINSLGTAIGELKTFSTLDCETTYGTDTHSANDSYTWIDGITYTESNNTATYTLQNAEGCDSIVTLNLTICHCGDANYRVSDYDGNEYTTVKLGEQCWMAQNLKTTHFANGTSISLGSTTSETTAYRYNPNNSSSNVSTYGYLYNWPAAMHGAISSSANPSNVQGICPNGWHLPSDAEWTQLTDYVSSQSEYLCDGNTDNIAKALASTTGWSSSSNTCAVGNTPSSNNSTGFGALPAGYYYGSYSNFGNYAYFWSATEGGSSYAYYRSLYYDDAYVYRFGSNKYDGRSVRCVRD